MKDDLLANLENTATAIFVTSNRTLTDNYYTLAYTLYPGKITDGFTDAIVIYSDSEVLYNHRFNIRCVRELK
jgi:hypothetical protein